MADQVETQTDPTEAPDTTEAPDNVQTPPPPPVPPAAKGKGGKGSKTQAPAPAPEAPAPDGDVAALVERLAGLEAQLRASNERAQAAEALAAQAAAAAKAKAQTDALTAAGMADDQLYRGVALGSLGADWDPSTSEGKAALAQFRAKHSGFFAANSSAPTDAATKSTKTGGLAAMFGWGNR